jgi:ubiquitin-conjugating enzyme E2 H
MYDLVNIFSIFLPQLLLYPNPKDPLNNDAARLLMSSEKEFNQKVKDLVSKHAMSSEAKKCVEAQKEKKESTS